MDRDSAHPDSALPTRARIEEAIAIFSREKNFSRRLCTALDAYDKTRAAEGFVWSKDKNPYVNKCRDFSYAYFSHLKDFNIPAFHVEAAFHDYLLLPVHEKGKTEILIYDPTAEQFFEGLPKPHLLGTKKEILALVKKGTFDGHAGPIFNVTYGIGDLLITNAPYVPFTPTPTVLQALAPFFSFDKQEIVRLCETKGKPHEDEWDLEPTTEAADTEINPDSSLGKMRNSRGRKK